MLFSQLYDNNCRNDSKKSTWVFVFERHSCEVETFDIFDMRKIDYQYI